MLNFYSLLSLFLLYDGLFVWLTLHRVDDGVWVDLRCGLLFGVCLGIFTCEGLIVMQDIVIVIWVFVLFDSRGLDDIDSEYVAEVLLIIVAGLVGLG